MHRVRWDLPPTLPPALGNALTRAGLVFLVCMGGLLTGVAQWSRVEHVDHARQAALVLALLVKAEVERRVDPADLSIPAPFAVALYAAEGQPLGSHPLRDDDRMPAGDLPSSVRAAVAAAADGALVEPGSRANARLWAWARSPGQPMVVVSQPVARIMAEWRHDIFPFFLFGLASLAGMTVLGAVALCRARAESRSQTRLRQAGEALEIMLDEKDALLAEVHHRVKDNMQVIVTLLQMEAVRLVDPAARQRIDALGRRVVLIGRVHERLYASDSFARMDLSALLASHCRKLAEGHPGADVMVRAEPLFCGLGVALPLALIADELVTNGLLHAGAPAEVSVSLTRRLGTVELAVRDPGQGPAELGSHGLGLTLIQVLAEQIGAAVTYRCGDGYCVAVSVPDKILGASNPEAPRAPQP